jgi:hypothetical protein
VEQAERHVRQAENLVARQAEIIAELERDGHPASALRARTVLATLCHSLALAREHLGRLHSSD